MKNKFNNFFREDINILEEYKVMSSKNMVKLDAMENPFDLELNIKLSNSPVSAIINLNRYPDAACETIRSKLLKKYEINDKYDMIIGNGSDELIQLICLTFLKSENIILSPTPSFSMYQKISQVLGLRFEEVPLFEDFSLDINLMLKKIEELNPAVIFLAFPNNPTGNLWSKEDINLIIKKTNGVVVIDEAYGAFSGETFIKDIGKYNNLIIIKTFSKIGLAGIRLGYLFGDKYLIKQINKIRLPFNINSISQKISEISMENNVFLDKQCEQIVELRFSLINQMMKFDKIKVFDSRTNFILFKILKGSADDVFSRLLENNILIKNMSNTPRLKNCLRVTVGTKKENDIFIKSLKNLII